MSNESSQETTVADIAAEATQESTPAQSLQDLAGNKTGASATGASGPFEKTFFVLFSVPNRTYDILGAAEFVRHHHDCFMEGRLSPAVIESMHATYEAALAHMRELQVG